MRLKVEEGNDLQVGAPMKGEVLEIKVVQGDVVEKGQGKLNEYSFVSRSITILSFDKP